MPTNTPAYVITRQHKFLSWGQAAWLAIKRAGYTMGIGLAVAGAWLLALNIAPSIEARYFPVIENVKLLPEPGRFSDPDLVAFKTEFDKNCDCDSLGRSWFVIMTDGTMIRVQAQLPEQESAPAFRPRGHHVGQLTVIRKPAPREQKRADNSTEVTYPEKIVGTQAYNRGLPWTSLVTLGPYNLADFDVTTPPEKQPGADPPDLDDLP